MEHTPGPWTMETVRTSCGVCFKIGPFPWKHGKLNHACIYADYPSPNSIEYKTAVANAILIAAAPDMLMALRRAVLALAFASEQSAAMRDDYKAVSTAIAKATGATQ